MNRDRYLVKSYGDNIDGTKAGLIKFLELCNQNGNGVIVVPMLNSVEGSILTTILGEELIKKLLKHRTISLENNIKISICSSSTLKNFTNYKTYLALWGSEQMIEDIEKKSFSAKSIVLVTWTHKDSIKWENTYPITVIYDDKKNN